MDSVVSDTNGLLISDFGSWQHEERDTILPMLTPSQRAAYLVMFKITIHLRRARPEKLNRHRNVRKLNSVPPWSYLNWLFFKILQFSGPSLLGMTSATLQPHFLSGGDYYYNWWLSYPLRTSVNCTQLLCTWTLNPNNSKPYQTEW